MSQVPHRATAWALMGVLAVGAAATLRPPAASAADPIIRVTAASPQALAADIANLEWPAGRPFPSAVLVVSGLPQNAVDAMLAKGVASAEGYGQLPLLLSDSPTQLGSATVQFLETHAVKRAYLIGADANPTLASQLPSQVHPLLLGGATRFDTAAAVLQYTIQQSVSRYVQQIRQEVTLGWYPPAPIPQQVQDYLSEFLIQAVPDNLPPTAIPLIGPEPVVLMQVNREGQEELPDPEWRVLQQLHDIGVPGVGPLASLNISGIFQPSPALLRQLTTWYGPQKTQAMVQTSPPVPGRDPAGTIDRTEALKDPTVQGGTEVVVLNLTPQAVEWDLAADELVPPNALQSSPEEGGTPTVYLDDASTLPGPVPWLADLHPPIPVIAIGGPDLVAPQVLQQIASAIGG
ncbi:MAG: hypothetical protein K6U87_09290 [Firmicutes bacterium]|nr:hypothetical protein [Bacillota bacterium]